MISIQTGGGHAITTTGMNGHGIVAYNFGTLPTSTTSINVGGNITTTGRGFTGGPRRRALQRSTGSRGPHRR